MVIHLQSVFSAFSTKYLASHPSIYSIIWLHLDILAFFIKIPAYRQLKLVRQQIQFATLLNNKIICLNFINQSFVAMNLNEKKKKKLPSCREAIALMSSLESDILGHSLPERRARQYIGKIKPQLQTRPKNKTIEKKVEKKIPKEVHGKEEVKQLGVETLVYEQFEKLLMKIVPPNMQKQATLNHEQMFRIYLQCQQKGGYASLSSLSPQSQFLSRILHGFKMTKVLNMELIGNIIFSCEFLHKNPKAKFKMYQLGQIKYVYPEQLEQSIKNSSSLKYFLFDLTLFKQGAKTLKIDSNKFNLDFMGKYYSNQLLDIRIQNPTYYSFKIDKKTNWAHQMTVGEYRYYQQNSKNANKMAEFKHAKLLKNGKIFFGVNFEPHDDFLEKEISKNVRDTFIDVHGKNDLLSYLDEEIPGCSSPQMYFKTEGCWTGGHQENLSMSALNINHGPGCSEWYTLELKYVDKLREQLKKQFNVDLIIEEGLWYEKLDWFIQNNYPVKKFVQEKDDIVVSGPGTLHWVRSYGKALQTSWNIMPKTYEQLEAAFHRQEINKSINFSRSNIIPLKSLVVKFLNHERVQMDHQIKTICIKQLKKWLESEGKILQSFFSNHAILQSEKFLSDLDSFCKECLQEVLIYYSLTNKEKKKGTAIICMECLKKQDKPTDSVIQIFYKYKISLLEQLIEISEKSREDEMHTQEISELCRSNHIGKIPTCNKIIEYSQKHKKNEVKKLVTAKSILNEALKNKNFDLLLISLCDPLYKSEFLQIQKYLEDDGQSKEEVKDSFKSESEEEMSRERSREKRRKHEDGPSSRGKKLKRVQSSNFMISEQK